MKYVFFGTPHFAAIVLSGLLDAGMPPAAVVCNPDRPVGRKHVITPPPVKLVAIASSPEIDIIQPETLDALFVKRLRELEPDFFVVAAYAKIIPQEVLDVPKLGTLGVHPSLLPKYRGASPIQSAILAGEMTTGVSIYMMDAKMDHGPVLAKESLIVGEHETYAELESRLPSLAGSLLARTIPPFMDGSAIPQEQDHDTATFTKKFSTQDGFVDDAELAAAERGEATTAGAQAIYRKILALNPEPGAWTTRNGKRMKLLKAALEDNKLKLTSVQEEGQKPKSV
jgi:methionyl-tRNA formyltransferase